MSWDRDKWIEEYNSKHVHKVRGLLTSEADAVRMCV